MNLKSGNTYLIIDDDEVFRNKLSESFQTRNLISFTAKNLANALDVLDKSKIDRIILDLKLNNENGIDFLCGDITEKYEIVILTGYGSVNTVKQAFKKGVKNYIQKPAGVDEIINSFEQKEDFLPCATTTLEDLEKDHINRVLVEQNGNISKAAKILGLHRRSLQRKLKN